ncbi:MAG: hemerythrin domain-containing protein [Thiohalocapsa sp.]
MNIIDALLGEHGSIYATMDQLKTLLASDASLQACQAALSLFCGVLEDHARVEEAILFPALDQFPQLKQGPLHVMQVEHETIDEIIAFLRRETDADKLREICSEFFELISSHFTKEEEALFPMSQNFLAAEQLDEFGRQWAVRRKVSLI